LTTSQNELPCKAIEPEGEPLKRLLTGPPEGLDRVDPRLGALMGEEASIIGGEPTNEPFTCRATTRKSKSNQG